MNIKTLIKKTLTHACVYFSVLTALYSVIVMIIYVDDTEVLLSASRILLFFIASLLFALANSILALTKLNSALKCVIHFLLTLFAFCSCMMLPISPDGSTMVVGIALFSVLYFIVLGITALFKSRYKKNADLRAEYKSQFSKK